MAEQQPQRSKQAAFGGVVSLALIAISVILVGLSPASLIILLAGLVPSATAFVTDRDPRRMLFWTVLPLNFAGTMIYVMILLHGEPSVSAAIDMLKTPTTWLVMYAFAGAGSFLNFVMPGVATAFLRNRLRGHEAAQRSIIKELRTEWGPDVGSEVESGGVTGSGQAGPT